VKVFALPLLTASVLFCLAGLGAHDWIVGSRRVAEATRIRQLSTLQRQSLTVESLGVAGIINAVPTHAERADGVLIVLGTTTGCEPCESGLPSFVRLLQALSARVAIERVKVLHVGPMDVGHRVHDLIAAAVPRQTVVSDLLIVDDPVSFSVKTGVVGLPFCIIAEHAGLVREIIVGALRPADVQAIASRAGHTGTRQGEVGTHIVQRQPYLYLDHLPTWDRRLLPASGKARYRMPIRNGANPPHQVQQSVAQQDNRRQR